MMWPIFWPNDTDFSDPSNTRHPSQDVNAAAKYIGEQIAAVVAAAGTSDDPQGYGQTVARDLLPDVLSYVVGMGWRRDLYKDWRAGQPVVFSRGWPLNADTWDDRAYFGAHATLKVYSGAPHSLANTAAYKDALNPDLLALTSMRPGQRPFRAPLSNCQRRQFSLGGRIFRDQPRPGSEGHAALGSRPRNGAARQCSPVLCLPGLSWRMVMLRPTCSYTCGTASITCQPPRITRQRGAK